MDPCVLTNLRKMLPLLKGFYIQMKASIDLLLLYVYIYTLLVYATVRACISTSCSLTCFPSMCLALLQEPASLLLDHSTRRDLSPGAQPAITIALWTWVSWLHLLSVGLLPPKGDLHHSPDSECLVSLLTACTIGVFLHDLEGEPQVQ